MTASVGQIHACVYHELLSALKRSHAWVLKECSLRRFRFPFIMNKSLQDTHTETSLALTIHCSWCQWRCSLFSILPCSVSEAAREGFLETLHAHAHAVLLLWRLKVMRYKAGAFTHTNGQWWVSYDAAGMTLAIAPACAYRSQTKNAHFTRTSVHLLLTNHHSKKEEPERGRERRRERVELIHSLQKLLPHSQHLSFSGCVQNQILVVYCLLHSGQYISQILNF